MRKPEYRHAQWGLLQQDPDHGEVLRSRYADQFFIPGSSAKLFSVSGTWHTLGGDHRFVTPVHAVGRRRGTTLDGDLDLIAQGDLTLGGRTRKNGTVAYTNLDHTYANDIPGATLTPQNPLAGIDQLARQVRDAGIERVDGDVVVPAVARYTSPSYAKYAELILKVSHNLGANLGNCLMATHSGSSQCADGFPVLAKFLDGAKVDRKAAQLADGRGGNPVDRATPRALAEILMYWQRTPDAERFRRSLPILGVDGTLAESCRHCPARGKVFAKTGTAAGGDALNDRLAVGAETAAGYLETRKGHFTCSSPE
ncbi:D-alanyl-D-alanine carboxypeptidase [Streptomyces sp. NPDC101150]|uniref:D-alanyl-D-alanine carboxypeptidase n=1 Tax=Streptomyces sp. NPDC101150 TaxID=3366114 RepID=UPI00382341FB